MATFDYAEVRADADELLAEFGTTVSVKVKTGQTHSNGRVTPTFTTFAGVKAVILPASEGQSQFGEGFMVGAATDRAIRLVLLSATGLTSDPGIGSILVIGSDEWAVTWRAEYAPDASTNVLFAIRAER